MRDRHPAVLRRFFPLPEPDPFYEETVLRALYGNAWTSVVVEDGQFALRHAFAVSAIGSRGLYDIEPLVGYAGPSVTTGSTPGFIAKALRCYSAFCREHGIVAELIRFNPLLANHLAVDRLDGDLIIRAAKPVVFLGVEQDDAVQLAAYPPKNRNVIRSALRGLRVTVLEKTWDSWHQFISLYSQGLTRTGASPEWRLPPELFGRLQTHAAFMLVAAMRDDRMVSAALALIHRPTVYYFLAASVRDPDLRRGASNAIVHAVTRAAAAVGAARVALGGGNTAELSDPLFRFKRSFGGEVRPFTIGRFTHNKAALDDLLRETDLSGVTARDSGLFLRYRLTDALGTGRMWPTTLAFLTPGTEENCG
jgi:hypothetical protein